MQKFAKKLSVVMAGIMTLSLLFNFVALTPAQAATVIPDIKYATTPQLEYTVGDIVSFDLNTPNYGGRVQYRIILRNMDTQQYVDMLSTTGDKYYTSWRPYGNEVFNFHYKALEAGTYQLGILVKRDGLANNKTALKGQNCDDYALSDTFVVKPAAAPAATVDSVATVADVTTIQGQAPVLPATVTLNMSDKTTKTAKVTWGTVDVTKLGAVTINGTVEGTDKKAAVKVTVNPEALTVSSVSALTNAKVNVKLTDAVKFAPEASRFAVKDATGKALAVKSTVLSADGKTVTVATDAQTAYAAYTLTIGDVTKTFVALPADAVKPTATAVVTSNNKVTVTFSEIVNKALAENIANYTIDNSLTVLKAELDSTGKIVTLTTSAQTVGTIYKLTVQNIADPSDNVMDKYEALFGGMAKDTTKPQVSSALVTGNTTVDVTFNEKMDKTTAENIANYVIDNSLTVLKAELDSTGTIVTLTTSSQTVGTIYKVTVNNVADESGNVMDKYETLFGGRAKDTTKPAATSVVVTANDKVTVTFSEKVNETIAKNIANYTVDNSLTVLKAELDSTGTIVTLTTSAQAVGTIYKITVQNIADIAGNVMDKYETLFGGMAKDTTAPTVSSIASSANTVTITYSEKVDKDSATNVLNYVFDGSLGYAASAALDTATGKVVTLTTASQTPGKIYSVTINGVKDLVGNTLSADTKKTFVGVGSVSASSVKVQAISIVNANTFDVIFDKELSATDVNNLVVTITKRNGATYSLQDSTCVKLQQTNKAVVRIQYMAASFGEGNVYEATVTGVANLVTTDSANVKNFAGTNIANDVPYVAVATALNGTAVKITFSEPVTNVTKNSFVITAPLNIPPVTVSNVSVLSTDKVTEAILYLSAPLSDAAVYTMTFASGVTDAAGYVAMKTANTDSTSYKVMFAGTNVANEAPKMLAVIPVDKYTFDIVFSEPVNNAAAAVYAVTKVSDSSSLNLTGAKYVASADQTKVTVKLDSANAALASGNVYELTYTPGTIADLQGVAYTATTGANKIKFGGVDTENAKLTIAAVQGLSKNSVKVVFSEAIDENTSDETVNGTYAIYNVGTTTVAANVTLVTFNAATNSATLVLDRPLNPSSIYDVRVIGTMKDMNQQAMDTTKSYNFTVGTATVALTNLVLTSSKDGAPVADLTNNTLTVDNNPNTHYMVQFKTGVASTPALANGLVALKLVASDAQKAALEAYYNTGKVDPWLTYLKQAANGNQPFVYIDGATLKLVDAAQYDLLQNRPMVDLVIPGDFPVGTYTVTGTLVDANGNMDTLTFSLVVTR